MLKMIMKMIIIGAGNKYNIKIKIVILTIIIIITIILIKIIIKKTKLFQCFPFFQDTNLLP